MSVVMVTIGDMTDAGGQGHPAIIATPSPCSGRQQVAHVENVQGVKTITRPCDV
jgi:hypothetical protein